MNFKLFTAAAFSLFTIFNASANDPVLVDSWNGLMKSGDCAVKLFSPSGDVSKVEMGETIDLEVTLNTVFHGQPTTNTYRFATAKKMFNAPAGLDGDLYHSAFAGKDGEVKLASALFIGVPGDDVQDLVSVKISIPHGGHAHNYSCNI